MNKQHSAAFAAIVIGMLTASGCDKDPDDGDEVGATSAGLKCEGGNECAGMSECASAEGKNECQGMNECKGMGWVTVDTEAECEKLGGTLSKAES